MLTDEICDWYFKESITTGINSDSNGDVKINS